MMIVVDNLTKNASKANASEIIINFTLSKKDMLLISFKDNGIGIPNRNIGKIFDFGFTTTAGSGLGLYHVKDVINKMKGSIEVSTQLNKGAEINITLPK
jgi:signal transduction histidine kinase